MKCQNCEKPATFHITDLTGDEIISLHLCPNCAKEHLHPGEVSGSSAPTLANVLKQQLNITQTAEELALPAVRPAYSVLTSVLTPHLGLEPMPTLDDAIARFTAELT